MRVPCGNRKKAAVVFAGLMLFVASRLPALPGISSYLSDDSGLYVYYRDYSFEYEAYVGFLQYDDATYAMRYYSPVHPVVPADTPAASATGGAVTVNGGSLSATGGSRSVLPKSVEILFTLNPDVSYTDMTGERFVSAVTADDTDLVNYLHDLVYELSARRRKVPGGIVASPTVIREEFAQFGGAVDMAYDFDIPLFGLKRISAADGSVLFDLVTAGLLVSSADTSFSAFKGFPAPLNDKQRKFLPVSDASAFPVEFGAQKLLLDSQWTRAAENMFVLGDNAILVVSAFDETPGAETAYPVFDLFTRTLSLGTQGSYADWRQRSVRRSPVQLITEMKYHIPAENAVSRDFKILTKRDKQYCILSLTVFDSVYKSNAAYFDSILKSYSVR